MCFVGGSEYAPFPYACFPHLDFWNICCRPRLSFPVFFAFFPGGGAPALPACVRFRNFSLGGFFGGSVHKAAPRNVRWFQKGVALYNRDELVQIWKGLWLQIIPIIGGSLLFQVTRICLHGNSFGSQLKHLAAVSQGDQFLSGHADYF